MLSSIVLAVSLTITFTGDVLLDRGVRRQIEAHGTESLFTTGVDSVLAASDLVVGNLECPATTIKAPTYKRFVFRAEPEWLDALRRHGFTHLNLANNHSVDQGRRGLEDTFRQVAAHGMTPLGAAPTQDKAARPVLLASVPRRVWLIPTLRLALENYPWLPDQWSVSQDDDERLVQRVAALRQTDSSAVIIVSPHWGWEHKLTPVGQQRELAHRLLDAGADLIIGHHTHTQQTIENYRGRYIYYSIGNFIFDQTSDLNSRACIVSMDIEAEDLKVRTLPIRIRHCAPMLVF
ncbi:MAG: CapA family protein [Bacteroidales bacterium]|nr:CapA family protein [Bacteroidales bacterium]